MKVAYSWLREYVDCDWPADQLAERLTMSGLKVEGLKYLGEGLEGVVTGKVAAVEPHPEADKLFVARVDVRDRTLTVVTGADNVQAGARVPVALPGARLPDGRVVTRVSLRGVDSEGMMCSEAELGLGDNSSGIMLLPEDAPVGKPLVEALLLDDWVFEFEIYPNRPDCQGVIGIAREVAALGGWPLRLPPADFPTCGPHAATQAAVEIADADLCRRYVASVARDVRIGPSPLWMQQRLRAAGMRPINNVVDITNYVMLEWGQPLHAFDLTTLRGARIVVRRARAGERLTTLDGQERLLQEDMLVIADGERPVAVAGVMGGADTEVTPHTRHVLLEAANFHPASVRRTARKLGLRTEASHRFEKGLDPELPLLAARRALHLMHRLAGASIHPGEVDVYPNPVKPWSVTLNPRRVNRFLGIELKPREMLGLLGRLGFSVPEDIRDEADDQEIAVGVPTFRADVQREADLAEEIVRLYGFDRVPSTLPRSPSAVGGQGLQGRVIDRVREVLAGLGLSEAINYSFVSPRHDDMLRLGEGHPWRRHVRLRNPLSEEQSVMRTNLLGGLLEAAARNLSRRVAQVHLFEIGAVFHPVSDNPEELPAEPQRLGLLMAGPVAETNWGRPARHADFFALKGVVEELARALRLELTFRPSAHPSFHPGRQAAVLCQGKEIGWIGEVHPLVLEAFDAPARTCAAELDLAALAAGYGQAPRYRSLPRFPLVRRDLALLVPKDRPAAEVEQVIREAAGPLLDGLAVFDVYEGQQVPEGYRSVGYTLAFRSDERTLTDEEVNAVIQGVEFALRERAGVSIRR